MPPVSVLIKPSSSMCNMHCDYCFYCDEAQKRKQKSYGFMSEETLKNVIRKTILRAEGAASYAFQGGEPTLCGLEFFEKVVFYQKKYNQNHIRVSNALQTNGYALDEKWCAFFKEHNFLIGVSLDGTKEIHDTYRHDRNGSGTYDKIRQGIQLLNDYAVDYNILTVVHKKTAANIEEIYYKFKENGWQYQQYIACLDPLDEEHGINEYALEPQAYGEFLIRLFHLWYKDYKKGRQPYIRQFDNYIGLLMGYQAESCAQNGNCAIQYVVEADGSVYPCDFYMLDDYCIGNFNKNNLDQMNQRRKEIGFIERSLKLNSDCKQCRYYRVCRGACHRERDLNSQTGLYENYFCKSYQIFFDACCEKMQNIADTISPIL